MSLTIQNNRLSKARLVARHLRRDRDEAHTVVELSESTRVVLFHPSHTADLRVHKLGYGVLTLAVAMRRECQQVGVLEACGAGVFQRTSGQRKRTRDSKG